MTLPANTAPAPLISAIVEMQPDDIGYARAAWRESYKESSAALLRMPWPLYKQTVGKEIAEILFSNDVRKLAAYSTDGKVIGWIAFTPGRTISAVHWCGTRHDLNGESPRRKGVMTALMVAAALGNRFIYTHRGPRRHTHRAGRGPIASKDSARGPSMDETLVEALGRRGVTAAYVPWEEFKR